MAHEISHDQAHDPSNVTNPEHSEHHIVSPIQYCMVFGTLLLFTAITVGAGFFTFIVLVTMTLLDYMSRAWGMW